MSKNSGNEQISMSTCLWYHFLNKTPKYREVINFKNFIAPKGLLHRESQNFDVRRSVLTCCCSLTYTFFGLFWDAKKYNTALKEAF